MRACGRGPAVEKIVLRLRQAPWRHRPTMVQPRNGMGTQTTQTAPVGPPLTRGPLEACDRRDTHRHDAVEIRQDHQGASRRSRRRGAVAGASTRRIVWQATRDRCGSGWSSKEYASRPVVPPFAELAAGTDADHTGAALGITAQRTGRIAARRERQSGRCRSSPVRARRGGNESIAHQAIR